LERNLNLLELK